MAVKDVVFRFETEAAAQLFLDWFSKLGEQSYWEDMNNWGGRAQDNSPLTVVFDYAECDRGIVRATLKEANSGR